MGFQESVCLQKNGMAHQPQYYSDYLKLDQIIHAQDPVSFQSGNTPAHDEMLFIIIHQAYELWFKQLLFELESVATILEKPTINDNTPDLQTVVHRIQRMNTILRVLVQQVDILETMTPMDFMDFRDLLRPASGFQSWQFKVIEARLGLTFDQRHGLHYYLSQLKPADVAIIQAAEKKPTLIQLVNAWLERMPFVRESSFWQDYQTAYQQSLLESEAGNWDNFRLVFNDENASATESTPRSLSASACRSAMFILLYRGYPLLELPFQLLEGLLEIDKQLGNWRYRHIHMVRRMIGSRVGTGGSTGAGYLQGAMDKHYIFRELSQLNSFLLERKNLPALSDDIIRQLGY
jgi:tryptophan 2,3-dioxygenase